MALICFDLDGTLVDPLQAMNHCLLQTCEEFGLAVPDPGRVAASVGRPCTELFSGLPGMDDPARLEPVLQRYWSLFHEEGIVRHRVYDGVLLMLARLKHQGHALYAVTVKPVRYARQVLHQFDLLLAFEDVFGGEPGAPLKSKGEVLAELHERGALLPGGFLVGDRAEDAQAARANGLMAVGVTYGFGSREELRSAGCEVLFESVAALDDWLKETLQEPEIHDSFAKSE
jgi:phosphoglycolate phosphatase